MLVPPLGVPTFSRASDLKSGFRMRSQKPSFVAVDLHAHVPQETTDSHSSNSSSSSSSSKPRTKASVSFAEQIKPYSSNLSLSVQSSGPMDLVSASCNISSLRDVELSALLSGSTDHEVLIDKFQIDMTRKKISCLKPRTWLNYEVINFYGEMMMQEGGNIHSFNTLYLHD